MARRRYQKGCLFTRGGRRKVWVARWREDVMHPDGSIGRVMRSEVLGTVAEIRTAREARNRLDAILDPINRGRRRPQSTMLLERFVHDVWTPAAAESQKPGSARYYDTQLRVHILPAFGSHQLGELSRVEIQRFLADKRKQGYSGSSVHGMRTTLGKIMQAAVEWEFVEQNPARGIRIGDRRPAVERPYLSAGQVRLLLEQIGEPAHTLVTIAVSTGLRIGELLALRWKHIDFGRGSIQVRETVTEGRFGSPKTRSSRRDVPMSRPTRQALERRLARGGDAGPEGLVFTSRAGTPLNPKNLLNRSLRPALKSLGLAPVSWHSFRHTHATLLGEVGESLRTAQAILGHSDLETTLNVYTHAIPESEKRAVDKVAEILFPNVPNFSAAGEGEQVN